MNNIERRGFATLIGRLSTMGRGAVRAVRGAVRAGQSTLESGMSAAAPKAPKTRKVNGVSIKPGGLQASFGSTIGRAKTDGSFNAKTGLAVGKSKADAAEQVTRGKSAVPYGHFRTLGTAPRFTGERTSKGRNGKIYRKKTYNIPRYRGKVSPLPYIVQAAEAATPAAEQTIFQKLEQQVQKHWKGQE